MLITLFTSDITKKREFELLELANSKKVNIGTNKEQVGNFVCLYSIMYLNSLELVLGSRAGCCGGINDNVPN